MVHQLKSLLKASLVRPKYFPSWIALYTFLQFDKTAVYGIQTEYLQVAYAVVEIHNL